MGCKGSKEPQYVAKCDNLGDRVVVQNFCSVAGPGGTSARINGCNRIGIAGEYGREIGEGGCSFKSGTNNQCTQGGGVDGHGLTCERIDFKGDTGWCCTVGLGPTGATSPCFVNNDQKQGTCHPNARSASGSGCMNFYLTSDNSSGFCDPSDFNEFKNRWDPNSETGYCYRALRANAEAGSVTNVRSLGQLLMDGYFRRFSIAEKGQVGYNDFQETVLDICRTVPYACGDYLKQNLCVDYTREDVIDLPSRHAFCGCHLQSNQYETFLNEKAGVRRECDTICIADKTIKVTDSFGELQLCKNTICAIDNVTIDLINSSAGDINFGQVCGGDCANGGCSCMFKDINISGENSKIGNINFQQSCTKTQCFITSEEDGSLIEVDCEKQTEDPKENNRRRNEENDVEGDRNIATIFIIIGVVVFILMMILIIMLIR